MPYRTKGTIRDRGKGVFRVSVELRSIDGIRQRKGKTIEGNKSDAKEALRQLVNERVDNPKLKNNGQVTVAQWCEAWYEHVTKKSGKQRKPTTLVTYRQILDKHIIPGVGDIRLRELDGRDLDNFFDELKIGLRNQPLGLSTRGLVRRVLVQLLRYGVKKNYLALSPHPEQEWDDVDDEAKKMIIPNDEQLKALLHYAAGRSELLYSFIYTGLHTGLRRGELLGLKWEDIDRDKLELTVRNNLVRVKGQNLDVDPKSKESRRTIDISSDLREVLDAHYDYQVEHRALPRLEVNPTSYVFSNELLRPINPDSISRRFRKLRDAIIRAEPALKFPNKLTVHSLRHTHVSYILNEPGAGVNTLIAVSERLGHSSLRITMDTYTHLIPEAEGLGIRFASIMAGVLSTVCQRIEQLSGTTQNTNSVAFSHELGYPRL